MSYYSISVNTAVANQLSILLNRTSLYGDPQLFLGFNYPPTRTNYTRVANSLNRASQSLSLSTPQLQSGTYYVGVLSQGAMTYSISAELGCTLRKPFLLCFVLFMVWLENSDWFLVFTF